MVENLDERSYDLLFSIRRSARYHYHRRRFYEICNTVTVAISVFGGSLVVTTASAREHLPGLEWLPVLFGAIIAVSSAISLAVGTSRQANLHAELARDWIYLEAEFNLTKNLEDDEYLGMVRKRLLIEAREPPPMRLLDAMCHYEILRSLGHKKKRPRIPMWRRATRNLLSQSNYTIGLEV